MTRDETKKLLMVLSQFYSNFNPSNLSFATDVWHKVIGGHDYKVMEKAVMDYVNTNTSGFSPVPAQLIELAYKKNIDKDAMTAQEAWDMVLKALSRSAYYFDEEFKKLPEVVQKCVGSAYRLHQMAVDEDFNPGVEYSLFSRTYNELSAKEREQKKIALIDEVNNDTKRLGYSEADPTMALPGRLPDGRERRG